MNQKQLFAAIRAMGLKVSFSAAYEEYRLTERPSREDAAYYTADKEDLLGTATHMAAQGREFSWVPR